MSVKGSIFNKMIILIVVLLIPVILLYMYFNQVSEGNTKREIENSALGQLSFFLSQVETNLERMSFYTGQISQDPGLHELKGIELGFDLFNKWKTVMNLSEKLRLLSSSNKWENRINLYIPSTKELISTDASATYQNAPLDRTLPTQWTHGNIQLYGNTTPGFVYYLIEPASFKSKPQEANFIVEISFADRSLVSMLDQFKLGDRGDPFFYDPHTGPIVNRSANHEAIQQITTAMQLDGSRQDAWTADIEANGGSYMTQVIYSPMMGLYLVNYYPTEVALSSIHSSRSIFYLSIATLILICLIATLMFYRHVQTPIKELVRGMQRVKMGDYSFRIRQRNRSEFQFLFERYNEMSEEIQTLIEHVYMEKLRSREAVLKQLQSQINPHFLYNSLNFIKTMSIIGNEQALEVMVVNLGEFFRYATRSENRLATVQEEVEFVRNYLSIQQLRTPRLQYEIEVAPELEQLEIPRILLQPIVENAIVHGVETKLGSGFVKLTGDWKDGLCRIRIEDSGGGLTPEQMAELEHKITMPLSEEMGCGVWNVHQRLKLEFGADAGLTFFQSELGGLGVMLAWPNKSER